MSKKVFKTLVASSLLVFSAFSVSSCIVMVPYGTQGQEGDVVESDITAINITNKEDLVAEWHAGDASRKIEATLEGVEMGLLNATIQGYVVIESSAPEIVEVSGLNLIAKAEGNAVITLRASKCSTFIALKIEPAINNTMKLADIKSKIVAGELKDKDVVEFNGYITGLIFKDENQLYNGVWVQDGDAAIQLYAGNITEVFKATPDIFTIGNKVHVKGTLSPYNGLNEVKPTEITLVEDDTLIAPTTLALTGDNFNADDLAGKDGQLVSAARLIYAGADHPAVSTESKHTTLYFKLEKSDGSLVDCDVYVNYHIGTEQQTALRDIATNLVAGDIVSVEGLLSWYNKPQITFGELANGKKPGDCMVITGEKYTFADPASITITSKDDATSILVGKTLQLTASVLPVNAVQTVTWSSSNTEVATVSEKGVVKGIKAGEVTITATSTAKADVKQEFVLSVENEPGPDPEATSLIINAEELMGYSGTNITYGDGTASIDTVPFSYTEVGAYGNGMQMRTKDSKSSTIWNTGELAKPISELKIKLNADKTVYTNEHALTFYFGDSAAAEDYSIQFDTAEGQYEYTIPVEEAGHKYFKLMHSMSYTLYVDSVELVYGEGGDTPVEPVAVDPITLTAENLMGYAGENMSYGDGSDIDVGGKKFDYIELGAYGNGMQMRTKNGKSSTIVNKDAFDSGVKEIKIKLNADKTVYDNANALTFSFGDSAEELTYDVVFDTVADTYEYTLPVGEAGHKYFKMLHTFSYTLYVDSIELVFDDVEPVTPVEPVAVDPITLTAENLMGYAGENMSYGDGSDIDVGGKKFDYIELGAYGNGMQMRTKNGKSSTIVNKDAFDSGVKEIKIKLNADKTVYDNANALTFSFGDSAEALGYDVVFDTVADTYEYTLPVGEAGHKYFKMLHTFSYTLYVDSIQLVFDDAEPATPVEPGGPVDPEEPPVATSLALTAENLLGYTGTQIGYGDGTAVEVNGKKFDYVELGAYGNGLQMRSKNGKSSTIVNTDAFDSGVKEIKIKLNAGKTVYDNASALTFSFGDSADELTYDVVFDTVADTYEYTLTVGEAGHKYFKMLHTFSYTLYVDSIELVF